jgi:hypothetical protein
MNGRFIGGSNSSMNVPTAVVQKNSLIHVSDDESGSETSSDSGSETASESGSESSSQSGSEKSSSSGSESDDEESQNEDYESFDVKKELDSSDLNKEHHVYVGDIKKFMKI